MVKSSKTLGKIWFNNRLVPFGDAKVHVLTHGLHYSTAVFEGIRCYNTRRYGPAVFRLKEHIDRLFNSAAIYSMKIPYSRKKVMDAVTKTVRANKYKDCYIRPIAYYGFGKLGLTPKTKVELAIACWKWRDSVNKKSKSGQGIECRISSWIRIESRSQPMQAKAASNYGNSVLTRLEALEEGYDEGIMLNYQGKVSEASAENIFMVKDNRLYTPPLQAGVLEGITRDSVIQIAKAEGIEVEEKDIDRNELYDAQEVFITGTASEIKPVTKIDRKKIGTGREGSMTLLLKESFRKVVTGNDKRFLKWLTPIQNYS